MNLFSCGFMFYVPFFPSLCHCSDAAGTCLSRNATCSGLPAAGTRPTLPSPGARQEQGELNPAPRCWLAGQLAGQTEQVRPVTTLQLPSMQIPNIGIYLLLALIFFSMIAAEFVCHPPTGPKSLAESWQTETQTLFSLRDQDKNTKRT